MDFNWFESSLWATIGIILSRITDIIKFLREIFSRKKEKHVYTLDKNLLKRATNGRFGFTFLEPRTWDRRDPMNGDGNGFVHPKNEDIQYLVYGSHNPFDFPGCQEWAESEIEDLKKYKKFKLLLSRQSGTYFVEEFVHTSETMVEGWRLKYSLIREGKEITCLRFLSLCNGIMYSVYCEAPSKIYPEYEDFFISLIAEFRITRGIDVSAMRF